MSYKLTYNDALKRVKIMIDEGHLFAETAEAYFPELKGSEEERITACIGLVLSDALEDRFKDYGVTLKQCLDWLEKQGGQKLSDKVEPKFKVGDVVISTKNQDIKYRIAGTVLNELGEYDYVCKDISGGEFDGKSHHIVASKLDEWAEIVKENEDEKIRKELAQYLIEIIDNICSEEIIPKDAKILCGKLRVWVAWLEKQKNLIG